MLQYHVQLLHHIFLCTAGQVYFEIVQLEKLFHVYLFQCISVFNALSVSPLRIASL